MTEAEWLVCDFPSPMMRHLRQGGGMELRSWFSQPVYGFLPRKWRLFLAACCQRVAPVLGSANNPARRLIEFAERFTEREPTEEHRKQVHQWFGNGNVPPQRVRLLWALTSHLGSAAGELRNIAGYHAHKITPKRVEKETAKRRAIDAEEEVQCDLIRDIFGNPFRPVAFAPEWRTDTVVTLARQMYESREFGEMPSLADALQDAGCDDDDILNHCRGDGPHVRGCWVVDLVLGKE